MDKYLRQAIDEQNDGYLLYHARRFDKLLTLLHRYHRPNEAVLDVGRSPFSEIARQSLGAQIDTLGFEADKKTATGRNYHFDLNDAQNKATWRDDIPQYSTIVFTEVIEHLYTSPALVLRFLRSLLKNGGIIIMQTPNAAALRKRIRMVMGENPFHLISEDATEPLHFREYTKDELAEYCKAAGFKIEEASIENYFDHRYKNHVQGSSAKTRIYGLLNFIYRISPPSFRPGLCFVTRWEGAD